MNKEKIVSQLDAEGYFVGATFADPDPLTPAGWLIPGGAVEATPPEVPEGFRAKWDGAGFVLEEISEAVEEPVLPTKPTFSDYVAAIQKRLDDFARGRNYDGILSAATYAASSVPKFRAEGQYAVEARDATWAKGYEILAAVEAGERAAPTYAELAEELPSLVWPQ